MSAAGKVVLVAAVVVAALLGYRWWHSPERQIRRVLDGISDRMSHDGPVSGLAAAAGAAGLQEYLSPDVVIETGRTFPPFKGRDSVVAAAARFLAGAPGARFEFVDVQVTANGDGTAATVRCSVTATLQDTAGQQTMDAREVEMAMRLVDGRWVVERAAVANVLEPVT